MIDPKDVHSLSDFQRNAKQHIKRLRRSGAPEVLTVNGKAAVVVQDAEAYSKMIARYEHDHLIEAVRAGLEQAEAGKGSPLADVERRLRAKHGLARRVRRSA